MGDPRAVDADMVELIAATAERVQISSEGSSSRIQASSEGNSSRCRATEAERMAFASCVDDLSVEITINLEDINVDDLEKQPEMIFANLVKRRAKVKASTLTPQRKKERIGASKK